MVSQIILKLWLNVLLILESLIQIFNKKNKNNMQNLIIKNILILTLVVFSTSFALNDAPEPWQFGFQDPATPIMEGIINFHNHIMFFLTVIGIAVMWLLGRCIALYDEDVNSRG